MTRETKYIAAPLEIKELTDEGQFAGYASVFGVTDLGGDIIAPGAFRRSLREHRKAKTMPKMLWQHRADMVPGAFSHFEEDEKGLFNEGQLALDTQLGRETHALLKLGALDGESIGYVPVKWAFDEETGVRTLKEVDLWEVSIVTFPMNPAARVSAIKRIAPEGIKTIREFEDFLRDAGGFSHAQAKAIASRGFKPTDHRDGDGGVEELALLIQRNIKLFQGA